jgi:sugar/nucleoside kinase (ribokinase family)
MPAAVLLGHAIVDVLARATDEEVAALDLHKGTMALTDGEAAERIYAAIRPEAHVSGGSAANSAACLASFGCDARFLGRVAADPLGEVFATDIRAAGVAFDNGGTLVPPPPGSGRCLILVTPDAERTMCTSLGAGALLGAGEIPAVEIADAEVLYLEGYVWGPEPTTSAGRVAIEAARKGGTLVSFSASDPGWVAFQRDALLELLALSDLLFANELEALGLSGMDDLDGALSWLLERVPQAVVTLGADGCVVAGREEARVRVPAVPVPHVVDTTGAGDSFAAGYLFGLIEGFDAERCARLGALAASEVVSHLGARPQVPLRRLAEQASLL